MEGFHTDDAEPFDDWLRSEQERYLHLIAQTLNTRIQSAITHNDTLGGVSAAARLLSLDPLREETHRHLMLLLAMDGQAGAALAQFEQCRQVLWEELGLEPDAETQELAERIEAGDFSFGFALPNLPRRRLHNLPAEMTEFFDRVEVTEQLMILLHDKSNRLVTVNGAGGIGKSRFVQHVGHRLLKALESALETDSSAELETDIRALARDGIYFVSLAGVEENAADAGAAGLGIVAAIVEALQLDMTGNADMLAQVERSLADHQLLLILDNFEQLQSQANVLVQLLQHAPGVTALVTSRMRLNVRGEYVVVLDGLPLPERDRVEDVSASPAGQLFIATAQSVARGFEVDEATGKAIARTCSLLQGLPLGIELAASWTAMLSCEEIAREIQSNLDFLESSMPDLPDRHRSLRAVFNQSWRLLSEDEQQTVQKLSIFRGGFTREAAEYVAGARLPILQLLVNKSLIRRAEMATEHQSRFEMPEVLRQYAVEHLEANQQEASTAQAFAAYFEIFLRSLSPELRSGDQHGALTQIAAEIENLRAAQQWAVSQAKNGESVAHSFLQACTDSLFGFYDVRGWFQEGASRFGDAVHAVQQAPSDGEPDHETVLLLAMLRARQAWFRFHLGEHDTSQQMLVQALATLEGLQAGVESGVLAQAGVDQEIVFVLNYLGAVLRHRGETDAAQQRLGQALAIATRNHDDYAASLALNTLGQVSFVIGDFDAAQDRCSRALRLKRKIGDRRGLIYSLTYLGRVAQARDELAAARTYFAEVLDIAEELGDPRGVALAQQNLGNVALADRQFTGARVQYQAALETFRRIGSLIETSVVLTRLSEIAAEQQQMALAIKTLQDALQTAIRVESLHALTTALLGSAGIFARLSKTQPAMQILAMLVQVDRLDRRQQLQIVALCEQLIADSQTTQVEPDVAEVGVTALVEIAEETIDRLAHLRRQI